jgi:mono/diheme cytochrome c family protein
MKHVATNLWRRTGALAGVALAVALAGCRQEMADQPFSRPLAPSTLFADGRASRPIPDGTVARTKLDLGPFYTGRTAGRGIAPAGAAAVVAAPNAPMGAAAALSVVGAAAASDRDDFVTELPVPADRLPKLLTRGHERFDIYCSPCHDRVGTGRGMIVQRGFTAPPSFHTDLSRGFLHKGTKLPLREAPVGYFFEVVTNGYGAMPDYRAQIPPADRWAIVAYVRALQFSQHAPLDAVRDAAVRRKLADQRGAHQ